MSNWIKEDLFEICQKEINELWHSQLSACFISLNHPPVFRSSNNRGEGCLDVSAFSRIQLIYLKIKLEMTSWMCLRDKSRLVSSKSLFKIEKEPISWQIRFRFEENIQYHPYIEHRYPKQITLRFYDKAKTLFICSL